MNKRLTTLLLAILIVLVSKSEAATLTQKIGDSYIKAFVSEGEQVTLQFAANKSNYTFTNWEVEKGNISINRNSSSVTFTMPSTDVVIKANYAEENIIPEYTLTYDANEGTGAPAAQIGSSITISSTIPTREGYTFLGWSTSRKAATATYVAGNKIDLKLDTILYAIWKINDNGTAKLVYNQNTTSPVANMPIDPAEQELKGIQKNYDFVISDVKPTRSGYYCIGWSKNKTSTTASYVGGNKLNVGNETVTLYAVWKYDCFCRVCNNPVEIKDTFCEHDCKPCPDCGEYCLIHEEGIHENSNCESGRKYKCYCQPCGKGGLTTQDTFCGNCTACSKCETYCLIHERGSCSGCGGCEECCTCNSLTDQGTSNDEITNSGTSSGGNTIEYNCKCAACFEPVDYYNAFCETCRMSGECDDSCEQCNSHCTCTYVYTVSLYTSQKSGATPWKILRQESTTGSATITIPNSVPSRTGHEFKSWSGYVPGDTIRLTREDVSIDLYLVWYCICCDADSMSADSGVCEDCVTAQRCIECDTCINHDRGVTMIPHRTSGGQTPFYYCPTHLDELSCSVCSSSSVVEFFDEVPLCSSHKKSK